jgi:hypothetical protein
MVPQLEQIIVGTFENAKKEGLSLGVEVLVKFEYCVGNVTISIGSSNFKPPHHTVLKQQKRD